jgi:hypothetical protein
MKKLLALFIIELIILLPIALVQGLTISNVKVEDVTPNSAKITFQTDKNSEGRINYGTTGVTSTASSPNFVKDHSIQLSNLLPSTIYKYELIAQDGPDIAIDNNKGLYYTFPTLAPTALFVEANIPANYNKGKKITIGGTSLTYARINLYVNTNTPREVNADAAGKFIFRDVELNEGTNVIKVTAKSDNQIVEKTYQIKVDTITPVVNFTEPNKIIGENRIKISGTVSEPVKMSFFVTSAAPDTTPPPKIANFTAEKVESNLVELSWKRLDIEDFAKYIIYRDDKAIAVVEPESYTDFSDAFVNANTSYNYHIAAMDKAANIGPKSDPVSITTPEGGVKNRPEPPPVDILADMGGLQKSIATAQSFSEELTLGNKDGFYNIQIAAMDEAGNAWLWNKEVLLDTKDPEIDILSPRSNADIYESYADAVTLRGKTEPGARVYLYVERTPLGIFEDNLDISGLPDKIQDLKETDFRANCNVNIQGEEQCKTHADFETVAGPDGYFEFENVDLTSMWAGAFRITEYPTGEAYYQRATQRELTDYMLSNLVFIAVDPAGRVGAQHEDYRIATCWSSDLTWDAVPLVEYQSPTFLNIERLKLGTETIYFYLNFSYHGQGKDGKIVNLLAQDACGTGYLENKDRFNYSCSILKSCTEKLSPNGKTAYIACPLSRLQGVEKWSDENWETFVKAVKDEMAFPFKLKLLYDEEYENNSIMYGQAFDLCTEVSYVVDATVVNPKDVLPDWLLYDAVDYLNQSITHLNDWILQIRKILEWTAIGCIAAFFIKFVTQVYRRFTCDWQGLFQKGTRALGQDQQDSCKTCLETNDPQALEKFKAGKEVQDIISDTCLQECYPGCASAWKSEESLYQTYRWACDRVFGHTTPSKWTEDKTDTELYQKLTAGAGCADDQSVRGMPLRVVSCQDMEKKYRLSTGTFDRDDKCVEISTHTNLGGSETLYLIGEKYPQGENVYKISKRSNDAPEINYEYVIKQNEDYYLAPLKQSCEDICKQDITNEKIQLGLKTSNGQPIEMGQNANKGVSAEKVKVGTDNNIMLAGCITTNQCLSYQSGETKQAKVAGSNTLIDVKTATPMGYTSDCFQPSLVSGDPNKRVECCCVNSQAGAMPGYYQPGEIENEDDTFSNEGYENMDWSYRYWKIGYKNKEYNPNRYIEDRDQMACFGQNHWLIDGLGGGGNLLIINPMQQHISAFQCVAISQILNRLSLLRNLMVALENCLLSVRTLGQADTGVCKEIFTQYVCAFIWRIITWITSGCLPWGSGLNLADSDNQVLAFVSVGMKGLWDSVGDSQQEIANEYGNAQLSNLLGFGEEEVFRKVCLGAFGYDWEIDADAFVDIAYQAPSATFIQTVLPSREYLTYDPLPPYKSKYEYRSSWMINPGCALANYEVTLACVTRDDLYNNPDIDCSKQGDPWGSNCDCLDLPAEKAPPDLFFYGSRGKLKQNQLINVDSSEIGNRVKTSSYRYDHLKFKLNVDRNYIKNNGDISQCFPSGHADGVFYFPITDITAREVAGCLADASTGIFSCREGASFFDEQGAAWFQEISVGDEVLTGSNIFTPKGATLYSGNTISATVNYEKNDQKQCLVARLLDENKQSILAHTVVDLPQGTTSGSKSIGTLRSLTNKDVSGEGYGFELQTLSDSGERVSARLRLSYTPTKAATSDAGGGSLVFIDAGTKDGKITISQTSSDMYSYKGVTKAIKDCYQAGGCDIRFDDLGAEVIINQVLPSSTGTFDFWVEPTPLVEGTGSFQPKFYLYLDLRNPKTPGGNCREVEGVEYDNIINGLDQAQIIVANGVTQRTFIPIYVLPSISKEKMCDQAVYSATPLSQSEECQCGTTDTTTCPRSADPSEPNTKRFTFCYGLCRQYPKCPTATLLGPNDACVCKPGIQSTKFDCGGAATNPDYLYYNTQTPGKYCYDINGAPTCSNTPPDVSQIPSTHNGVMQVKISKPDEGRTLTQGESFDVTGQILDTEPKGQERYQIALVTSDGKTDIIDEGLLLNDPPWDIAKTFNSQPYPLGRTGIYIIGRDDPLSQTQIVTSNTVTIYIQAK